MAGLLIGIDDYTHTDYPSLAGAEADARQWRDFLVHDLGVPDANSHITMLLGQSATRQKIIDALRNLASNDYIKEGDPIFIFYAGHGGEVKYRTPDGFEQIIQMVVPSDYCGGEKKNPVYCITDLEIGALIDYIAERKGDNITVIMDCCHAASGTRGDVDSERRVRTVPLPESSLDPEFDRVICHGVRPTYSRAGLKSHMLLAACASNEKAHELRGHGQFSTALLDLFRRESLDHLRYCDILPRMQCLPDQNPQCEGVNRYRFIFNAQVSCRPLSRCYKIGFRVPDQDPRSTHIDSEIKLVLDAGSAQGVTIGAEFNIYAHDDPSFQTILGTAIVETTQAFSALMKHSSRLKLPHTSVALQVRSRHSQDLLLFIPHDDYFVTIFKKVINKFGIRYQLNNIIPIFDKTLDSRAHLKASMGSSSYVTFELTDHRATQYGFNRKFSLIDGKDLHEVARVLSKIAHYYRELNREAPDSNLRHNVDIGFYKLGPHTQPDWRKLTPEGPNLFRDGIIDFEVSEGAPYGIKLLNKGGCDVYPYFFYFNNNDLSISSIYESSCPTGYKNEAPLKSDVGTLTFGYGSSGVPPCTYKLEHEFGNVDFLKILFTTKPIDISNISISSPFKITRGLETWTFKMPDTWDTICIPLIQRRPRGPFHIAPQASA